MTNAEPDFEKIRSKATELYIKDKGEPPPDEPMCMTLKITPSINESYWKKAKEILYGVESEKDVFASHITKRSRPESSNLLRPTVAARELGVSYKTLWRWWKEGRITAVRLPSGRLRYPRDETERILQM